MARHDQDLEWDELGKRARIPASSMSLIKNEKQPPSAMQSVRLAEALEVDLGWLLSGKGEMRPAGHGRSIPERPAPPGMSPEAFIAQHQKTRVDVNDKKPRRRGA